jgi:hypothetical protein
MIRKSIFAVLLVCFVFTSPVLAGTWKDDFEDGDFEGWELLNPEPEEKWAVEDGECSGQWANAPAFVCSAIILALEGVALWKDYSVVCKAKLVEKLGGEPFFGICFRALPPWEGDHQEDYQVVIWPDERKATFYEIGQNADQQHLEVPLPFDISENTWYKLEVIAEGEHFGFHINDELIGSFDDDSRPSGTVLLMLRDAHVHFDDVVITGPEIPDGGPGFAVTSQSKLAAIWGSVKRYLQL